jgi:uncharacterized protein (DUF488 family)
VINKFNKVLNTSKAQFKKENQNNLFLKIKIFKLKSLFLIKINIITSMRMKLLKNNPKNSLKNMNLKYYKIKKYLLSRKRK